MRVLVTVLTRYSRLLGGGDGGGSCTAAGKAGPGEGPAEQGRPLAELSGTDCGFFSLGKAHLSLISSDFESHVSPSFASHTMVSN